MKYRHSSHTKFKIEYHFVWVRKYRYQVLLGDIGLRVRELTKEMIKEYLEHHFERNPNNHFDVES